VKSLSLALPKPEDVFTPRHDSVHSEMYVHRPEIEGALRRALRSAKNIVVHGESGSGKSWLYKRVFEEDQVDYEVVNLGRASGLGSISNVVESVLARGEVPQQTSYSETKEANINAVFLNAGLNHAGQFSVIQRDIFERCLSMLRERAGERSACLVFDNLEHVLDDAALLKELAGLVLLVDDQNYAQYKVKLLLVGTPGDIRSYITDVTRSQTITNRLTEIPEVSRLDPLQAAAFVAKGFFDLLSYEVSESPNFTQRKFISSIVSYTDGVPQHLQDLCLAIAYRAQDAGGIVNGDVFNRGRYDWVREALISELSVIEANLNSRSTKHGRKNQVVYAIGQIAKRQFLVSDVEAELRRLFPSSTSGVVLNVAQTLSELSKVRAPILRKCPDGRNYRFVDPRLRIVIRVKMELDADEKIHLLPFEKTVSGF
jgi:hypothetical protein